MTERACPNCSHGPVEIPELDSWMRCPFCSAVWRTEIKTTIVPGELWKKAWG